LLVGKRALQAGFVAVVELAWLPWLGEIFRRYEVALDRSIARIRFTERTDTYLDRKERRKG
jgi:hypothetical protein